MNNKELMSAHEVFLAAIDGNPKNLNISQLSRRTGIPIIRLWRYANGRCGWRVDEWLLAMAGLNRIDLIAGLIEEIAANMRAA